MEEMSTVLKSPTYRIEESLLQEIDQLLKNGLNLSAWQLVPEEHRDLKNWDYGFARRCAARLASQLGNGRLGDILNWTNARRHRDDDVFFFNALFSVGGVTNQLAIVDKIERRFLQRPEMLSDEKSDLLVYQASIIGELRDLTSALSMMTKAYEMAGEDAWRMVIHAQILAANDKFDESLSIAHKAHEMRPFYRPAVLQLATAYVNKGDDDSAIALLQAADKHTEEAQFAVRLQTFYSERHDWKNGLAALERIEQLTPLASDVYKQWIAARKIDFHYQAKNYDLCLELKEQAGKSMKHFLDNVQANKESGHGMKRLDVTFTRQHNMTCAPATLASIAKYWNKPHEHLEIASEICYDGTPWHKERLWAEQNGFYVKEFRVDKNVTKALIDAGVPFTLTTSWVGGAHLQACIGYDDIANTIVLRDPTYRHYTEYDFDHLVKEHPIEGPRGLLLIPEEEKNRLDGITFHDSLLYDEYFNLLHALDTHQFTKALEAITSMRVIKPDHPLILRGELTMAYYQTNSSEELYVTDRMVERYPSSNKLRWARLMALQRANLRDEQLHLLVEEMKRVDCATQFLVEYAILIGQDQRKLDDADFIIRKALRKNITDAGSMVTYAWILEKKLDFKKAKEIRKFSSTLSDSAESYADAYFNACLKERKKEQGLNYLRERAERIGEKIPSSWQTLIEAQVRCGEESEAKALLESCLVRFSNNGDFLVFSAWKLFHWGERDRAKEIFSKAHGKISEFTRLSESASMADLSGQRFLAREYWIQAAKIKPSDVGTHRNLAHSYFEEKGTTGAIQYLENIASQHKQNSEIQSLLAEWVKENDPAKALQIYTLASERSPNDQWLLRERSLLLQTLKSYDEAIDTAKLALLKGPNVYYNHGILGDLYLKQGLKGEGVECLKSALRLNIDYTYAVEQLMDQAANHSEARGYLSFINSEMNTQVSNGEIVPVYYERAKTYLSEIDLSIKIKSFREQRPDLAETWYIGIEHATLLQKYDEALLLADEVVKRNALTPRVYVERALVYRLKGDKKLYRENLEKAVELSPFWLRSCYLLADLCEEEGKVNEAVNIYERLIDFHPKTPDTYVRLAKVYHANGKKTEALEVLSRCVSFSPGSRSGWDLFTAWKLERNEGIDLKKIIDQLLLDYPNRESAWMIATDVYFALGDEKALMDLIDRGLSFLPKSDDLHDTRAFYLAHYGKFEEAIAACKPEIYTQGLPKELKGREAYIYFQMGLSNRALSAMCELTKEYPDYIWAHHMYVNWLSDREEHGDTREAVKAWLRADPKNAVAWGHLANVELKLNNQAEHNKALETSFNLDPSYLYAGKKVLETHLKSGKIAEAEDVLRKLRYYTDALAVTLCELQVLLAKKQEKEATFLMEDILKNPYAETWIVDAVHLAMKDAKLESVFKKALNKIVEASEAKHGDVISAYFYDATVPLKALKKLDALKYEINIKIPAHYFLMDWMHNGAHDKKTISSYIKGSKNFKTNTALWGRIGWLCLTKLDSKSTIKWLSDYRSRTHLEASMMHNLALAYANEGKHELSMETHRYAVEQLPKDYTYFYQSMLVQFYDLAFEKRSVDEAEFERNYQENTIGPDSSKCVYLLTKMLMCNTQDELLRLWQSSGESINASSNNRYLRLTSRSLRKKNLKWPGGKIVAVEDKEYGSMVLVGGFALFVIIRIISRVYSS